MNCPVCGDEMPNQLGEDRPNQYFKCDKIGKHLVTVIIVKERNQS